MKSRQKQLPEMLPKFYWHNIPNEGVYTKDGKFHQHAMKYTDFNFTGIIISSSASVFQNHFTASTATQTLNHSDEYAHNSPGTTAYEAAKVSNTQAIKLLLTKSWF